MTTIGVVGASGSVASEVCLFLSLMDPVRVVPICAEEPDAAFLERCGLKYRCGTLDRPGEAFRLLAGCDLVADFSLAHSNVAQLRPGIRRAICHAVRNAPRGARYVYVSVIGASGDARKRLRLRTDAYSVLAATHRYAERVAFDTGRRERREVYLLRLGQVRGELQAVSRAMLIAEALAQIAHGRERPGLYTLATVPPWCGKPGQRLRSISSSRTTMEPLAREVRRLIQRASEEDE